MSGLKDCIKKYASKHGCTLAEADTAMRQALEVIKEEIVQSGGVSFIGDFSIEVAERQEKKVVIPATKETHIIPAHRTLRIKVGKNLKKLLNS